MHSTLFETALEVWQAEGCPFRIEYSTTVAAQLRLEAVDGFHRLAHGGMEIGGVLFGLHGDGVVKIQAHRPLECEHQFGPSFTLSGNDRRALENLLVLASTEHELAGMQPVGWYHSHTRTPILLSAKDLELYRYYFPKAWQIALVLRPNRLDPVRAGFFFREADGAIHAESSRQEFVLPVAGRQAAHSDAPPPDAEPADAPLQPLMIAEPAASESTAHRTVAEEPAAALRPPRVLPGWAWVAAAALFIAAGTGYLLFGASPGAFSLRAVDVDDQLRIDWDRASRIILRSQGGEIEIQDGGSSVKEELSQEHLRAGNVTYMRSTGSVLVRLAVRGTDGSVHEEMTRFLGPPPKISSIAPADGTIIWTGNLARSRTVRISRNRASLGDLSSALPGVPVRVHILPAEITPNGLRIFTADPELISAQRKLNRAEYVLNPRKATEVRLVEAPSPENGWQGLTLRADRGDHSMIILQWERVTAP